MSEEIIDDSLKEKAEAVSKDRDQLVLKHILESDEMMIPMNHASAHLNENGIVKYHTFDEPISLKDFNEGKERIVFVMCPCWGVVFPPYGLAKIVATIRENDYACKVYDLNVQMYHNLLNKTGEDYWRSEKFFYWQDPWFYSTYMAKDVNPFLFQAIDKIIEDRPTLVGFSLYDTNNEASFIMIKELRRRMPDLKIVVGGPSASSNIWLIEQKIKNDVDFIFRGEAEESFLKYLNEKTEGNDKVIGDLKSRNNLNDKAFADYSDYDMTAYLHTGGASLETSRGCTASCSFCSETNFWKFRSIEPENVIEEMKHQIKNYGVSRFWIVDSLINGNLKLFETLVDLMILNDLKIHWNSYSRCDGRMTAEFLNRVGKSGCTGLSYGVESGSEKVLNDMRKKIEVWEIENNLRDTYNTNSIWTHVNWLIGFPTEEPLDYYHSNILIYNVRNHVHQLSPGMGCGIGELTDLKDRYKLYGIDWKENAWDQSFLNDWFTIGLKSNHLNRFMRVKMFHIWLKILESHAGSTIENPQRHDDINESYEFFTKNENTTDYLVQEGNIDFEIIKESNATTPLSSIIANEYFPIYYGLFKIFKGFKLNLYFDRQKDLDSWGSVACDYNAKATFEIDDLGNYSFTLTHELVHIGMTPKVEEIYVWERTGGIGDKSFKDEFSLKGNIYDWISSEYLVKETIHEVYRNKVKRLPMAEKPINKVVEKVKRTLI
jgi:hypothetical protein